MKDNGLPAPVIDTGDTWFSIAFPRVLQKPAERDIPLNGELNGALNEGINEGLKFLLKTIQEKPGVRAKDMGDMLNRPMKTIESRVY